MKKIPVFILSFLLLTSCGKYVSHASSVFICEWITKDGKKYDVSEICSSPPVLTLYDSGKALLEIDGESCEGKWEDSDEGFNLFICDRSSVGTLRDGVCSIDLFGLGSVYGFCSEAFTSSDSDPVSYDDKKNNRWSGEWYGYWGIQNASGDWENLDGQYFDCFAVIDMGIDNLGEITLWDENSSESEPFSTVNLALAPSSTGFGTAKSRSGFFFSCDVKKDEWEISPDKQDLLNVIYVSSHYSGSDGEFDYEIFLRPWGYVWDDAAANEYIRLPYHYDEWYIPMLSQAGSMPESFEP